MYLSLATTIVLVDVAATNAWEVSFHGGRGAVLAAVGAVGAFGDDHGLSHCADAVGVAADGIQASAASAAARNSRVTRENASGCNMKSLKE